MFNGIAQHATRSDTAYGIQEDGSCRINDQHTLRAGFLVQQEMAGGKTFSQVLPVDSTGTPTTDVPLGIGNSFNKTGGLYGVYVQDTLNRTSDDPTLFSVDALVQSGLRASTPARRNCDLMC